jgi:hypothetical protein
MGDKPPRKKSGYNVFRTIISKRKLGLTPHDLASLYAHASKQGIGIGGSDPLTENFNQYFKKKLDERDDLDTTDVVKNGFLRPQSEGYAWVTGHLKDWHARVKGSRPADKAPPKQYQQTAVTSQPIEGDTITSIPDKDTAKPVLRARAVIAGPEVVQETKEQQISDVVQADTFDYKPQHDADIGENNVLALMGDFNEQTVRFRGPMFLPRVSEGPNVMGFDRPSQFNESAGSSAVVFAMRDDLIEQTEQAKTYNSFGEKSYAPSPDNSQYPDPSGRASHINPFVPAQEQPGPWEITVLPAFANDTIGFKRDSNTWRSELLPEQNKGQALLPAAMQLETVAKHGFSYMY